MSERGGIGFVIDGELKLSYERNGMALEDYGYLFNFIKENSIDSLKERARNLVEVDPDALTEGGESWRTALRYSYIIGDSPTSRFYMDGHWIAYDRSTCVSIAILNLDDEVLEIYLGTSYSDVLEGRFAEDPERGEEAVNLFKVIPFTALPESAEEITEELYDRVRIHFRSKKKY